MSELNQSEVILLLNEIRAYLRINAAALCKDVATKVLDSQEKAMVFAKLDGNTSQSKIESDTKIPIQTINRWINDFIEAGLISPSNKYSKNYKALFTLRELSIDATELSKRKKQQNKPSDKQVLTISNEKTVNNKSISEA